MATIVFDVDDTLYDQLIPFKTAFYHTIQKVSPEKMARIYQLSRMKSEELFEQSETGEMSKLEMQIIRIQYACIKFDISLNKEQATHFQKVYQQEQQKITLYPEVKVLLNKLSEKNHKLVLLTNGPLVHQQNKISRLGLSKWISANHIFISGSMACAKPDKKAFEFVEHKLRIGKEKPIFIGDSYRNDIVGGKNAGWTVIWLNNRFNKFEEHMVRPDRIVYDLDELLKLFKEYDYFQDKQLAINKMN
ncbi:HAD family hydrolase [Carnobacterium sp.]|uniref:HAD family hydrolase n=1 Tax=Carnobacterium sp. TaxID=48221 RepID=UPI0028A8E0D9|nr:HAD family hydrolase [Carnobacterium sp.]